MDEGLKAFFALVQSDMYIIQHTLAGKATGILKQRFTVSLPRSSCEEPTRRAIVLSL